MANYRQCEYEDESLKVGQPVYVSEWVDVGPNPRKRFGGRPLHKGSACQSEAYLTNMGQKPLLRGWLGTTNDTACYALGVGVVVSVERNWEDQLIARVRLAREGSQAEEKLLEELG